jgi:hypothetical protein
MQIYFKDTYFTMMSQRMNVSKHLSLYRVNHLRIMERVCGILSNLDRSPNLLLIGGSWLVQRGFLLWNFIGLLRKRNENLYYVDTHLVEL